MTTLLITQSTWLKHLPVQSFQLPDAAKHFVRAGQKFELASHEPIENLALPSDNDQHIRVTLDPAFNGKQDWYVYQRHASIMDGDRLLFPAPEEAAPSQFRVANQSGQYRGKSLRLPNNRTVYMDQPIIQGGNFTWGEATHDGTRMPESALVVQRIENLARLLQRARGQIGRPFRVTSWYRPPSINKAVGGASRSQHLTGGAVDITVEGLLGHQVGQAVRSWWPGGLGIYPGNRRHILHLDIGPKRSWGGI